MAAPRAPRGRLGPWEGRVFLAVGRALYLGPAGDTTPHAHHALQMSVALDAPLRLRWGGGRWREYEGALVPPDVPHQLDGGWGSVLLLYLEPETLDGRRWLDNARGEIRALDAPTVLAVRNVVRELVNAPASEIDADRAYADLLASVRLRPDRPAPNDVRVALAVRRLRSFHSNRSSLVDLADEVGLSPSRFRHVFREEVGMSAQSYLVWMRIFEACAALARSASLSDAALCAGFSDAAHFTRTFRRTFGLAPSQVAGRLALMEATGGGVHAVSAS